METLTYPACTVGWVAQLCRSWLSPWKATRISHGRNPNGAKLYLRKKNYKDVLHVLLVFPQMSKVQRCTLCPSGLSTKGLLYLCPDNVPESVPHPPGPSPAPATRDSCLRCLPHPCRHRVYIVSPQSPAGGVLWLSAGDATCLGICKGDKYDKIHLEKKK